MPYPYTASATQTSPTYNETNIMPISNGVGYGWELESEQTFSYLFTNVLILLAQLGNRREVYHLIKNGAHLKLTKSEFSRLVYIATPEIKPFLFFMKRRQKNTQHLLNETEANFEKEYTEHIKPIVNWVDTNKEYLREKFWKKEKGNDEKEVSILKFLADRCTMERPRPKIKFQWIGEKIEECKIEIHNRNLLINYNPELFALYPPIVWGMPRKISIPNGYIDIDDVVYPGSTPEKDVYIPYTAIHKKLAEANAVMRAGKTIGKNYLVAHLVCIVSDRPHNKLPDTHTGEIYYRGGRRFIDFPIIELLNIFTISGHFKKQAHFERFLEERHGNLLGAYPPCNGRDHSEEALATFLNTRQNVDAIIDVLQSKLMNFYRECRGFKLYGVQLYINSKKNVCGSGINPSDPGLVGCEEVLRQLMTARHEGSFLNLLKTACYNAGIKTSIKRGGYPYVSITVSAHELYTDHCSPRLCEDAANALSDTYPTSSSENKRNLSVDIKKLAGRVVLSTPEQWIDRISPAERNIHIQTRLSKGIQKIPFQTGFKSKQGVEDHLSEWRRHLYHDTPTCLDGIPIWTVGKTKSPTQGRR